ncbi:hypothetical protein Q8A73_015523 [Channa argus]|nr:hypothetical protein Q8A73_015523 [Channa argus]
MPDEKTLTVRESYVVYKGGGEKCCQSLTLHFKGLCGRKTDACGELQHSHERSGCRSLTSSGTSSSSDEQQVARNSSAHIKVRREARRRESASVRCELLQRRKFQKEHNGCKLLDFVSRPDLTGRHRELVGDIRADELRMQEPHSTEREINRLQSMCLRVEGTLKTMSHLPQRGETRGGQSQKAGVLQHLNKAPADGLSDRWGVAPFLRGNVLGRQHREEGHLTFGGAGAAFL